MFASNQLTCVNGNVLVAVWTAVGTRTADLFVQGPYPKKQLPMWHQYRVELYPHFGQSSGIQDQYGNELEFPAAFRRSRADGKPKGIIKIGGHP